MEAELFRGRTAIVTGGARGIGFACAAKITAGGGRVALWDRDPERARQSAATLKGAVAIAVDVTSEADVARALAETEKLLAPPDILVASAGITGPNTTVAKYPVDAWRQVIDINLTGVFLTNRVVIDGMVQRGWGRVVNIASVAGKEGNPNASAYSASKAAVIGLTKSLGKELATTGVLVNCVAPAVVKTELFSQMTEQHINYMLSKIPMNRFGEVEEVAEMVAWLASSHCTFATGAVFDLSGGRATY
ncbi:SDR family NAD(P)-dependent oxidoreductase [Reyranella sp.]|jgi:3-oxoacyl-[acyl-carrier protein] reductase|uniref:SDR family NAD(P)-dependent oxidoreductase n=1 Tax=Reyranella sp. TaxID=1929291 RepID=UPI000BD24B7C|nr:SDR family NAD(P)-dependent oxidoreductase [Reyranella sp.]OYY45798.1 MAG: 3-oxoacyl-ACP reductase [Rhodospirillales bacterium 35-66-84]OYZ96179.1 MAG: 3-oxoacyl-ACP reductase [Rhodospirillales bacterium 24-66-33]OZB28659.1 MAG: 3-oxoacyl-ACP reductase [Rhodospirillales bacterium 39-66-50]HQS14112.1 SDR family NAD(P)-dependent oxidoreductase [Reyranella sp.]HQT11108.1 SDR family NAD(P)-dependent oxidoreductase [Reyranella sp.]